MYRSALIVAAGLLCACGEGATDRSLAPSAADFGKSPTNGAATFWLPLPTAALSVKGDGLFSSGGSSAYANAVCGVTATVFAPNPTQDGVMQTDNPSAGDRRCAAYTKSVVPRSIIIDYGDGTSSNPVTMNVHDIGSVTGTALRFLGIGFSGSSRCQKLQFGGPSGGDMVWVTKTSATSWHVYSQQAPSNTAVCVTSTGGVAYANMNVDFVVTTP